MELLPKPNLLPGTSGQEETQPEPLQKKPSRKRQTPPPPLEPVSESEPVVVEAAEDSVKLTPADTKLAIQMNRHIMAKLGLNKRSRSFRV